MERQKIILVTGSNGAVGNAVMQQFTDKFEHVIGFDRKAPAPPPPGCVYVPVDIASDESVREGLRVIGAHHGHHVVSVIHLAAYYAFFGAWLLAGAGPGAKWNSAVVGILLMALSLPRGTIKERYGTWNRLIV